MRGFFFYRALVRQLQQALGEKKLRLRSIGAVGIGGGIVFKRTRGADKVVMLEKRARHVQLHNLSRCAAELVDPGLL